MQGVLLEDMYKKSLGLVLLCVLQTESAHILP